MNTNNDRATKWLAILSTIFYIAVFPSLMQLSLLTLMVFGSPNMTTLGKYSFVFLSLIVPISMPIAVYYLWKRYSTMEYAKACFYCILPVLIAIISYTAIKHLDV